MLAQDIRWDHLPYFFTDQYNLGMAYAGWVPPGRDPRGDDPRRPDRPRVHRALDHRGLVVADMNVNIWDVTDEIQPLIRSGVRVDPVRLADPATLLTDLSQRNAARGYPLPIYRPTAARSA